MVCIICFWIYATAAITQHIYGTTGHAIRKYSIKVPNTVSGMMGNYNLIAAIVAFFIPVVAAKTSRKFVHFFSIDFGWFWD